jgi:hypothetical protein
LSFGYRSGEGRVLPAAILLTARVHGDFDGSRGIVGESDHYALHAAVFMGTGGWRSSFTLTQSVDDCVNFVNVTPGERAQERRNQGIITRDDGNQNLVLLNPCPGEVADFGFHPAAFE